MIKGIEKAARATATPIDPHNIDFRALVTPSGSPWADKNWKPATMNIITAKAMKIIQSKPNISPRILKRVA